ncbi:MAG: SCO1664 family protein [Marmoricola sp.]
MSAGPLRGAGIDPDAVRRLDRTPLVPLGRILPASNQTFLCSLGPDGPRVVYKPVDGERPLWDFTEGTLAGREYAAWLVSECLGWHVVPPTLLRTGPEGVGMVQLWCEPDPDQAPVDVVPVDQVPAGYRHVIDAVDGADQPVALVHEDTATLRRMAVFDIVVNNTDRKGGHVLPMTDGHRYGVDHGVCFHAEDKLRTVLWGWAGEPLTGDESGDVRRVHEDAALDRALAEHLTGLEREMLHRRCERLLAAGRFPEPSHGWPPIPWPPF